MKRSEMIQKLRKFFNDMDDQVGITDYGAELILDQLENYGMRPPLLLNQKYKGPFEGWEPENEEDPEDEFPRSGAV